MNAGHVSTHDLELYVQDALEVRRAAEVEAHVSSCARCGEALAREARFEVALEEIAAHEDAHAHTPVTLIVPAEKRRVAASRPRAGLALFAAGGLSLAAAWLLWLAPGSTSIGGGSGAAQGNTAAIEPPSAAMHAPVSDDAATASLDARTFDQLDGG